MNTLRSSSQVDAALALDAPDVLPSGKLCLEFANTMNWHASDTPLESLYTYNDLVDWAQIVGICSEEASRALKMQGDRHPSLAEQVYEWAIDLREAIYRIFVALIKGEMPARMDMDLLNEALPHAFTLPEIIATGGGYGWRWRGDEKGLDGVLWPVIRSAARLLTDGDHSRIGQCEDDRGCGYLFFDTSRNHSRRWCDMNSCGNRAKAHRHYARRSQRKDTAT
jgi:predicted RNA-binding Zn ribbon-like protein